MNAHVRTGIRILVVAAAAALPFVLLRPSNGGAVPAPASEPQVPAAPTAAQPAPKVASDPRLSALLSWLEPVFPWGAGETTLDELTQVKIRGHRLMKASKKYTVEARMNDTAFVALEDGGRWAVVGDAILDEARLKNPKPVQGEADLAGIREQLKRYLRGPFRIVLDPAGDRLPAFRGVKVLADTGYGTYQLSAVLTADDGAVLLLGRAWDRRRSIPEQRREMIRLPGTPFSGPADATVTVVEYSDMQCPFCKKRTADWEPLLEKLGKDLKVRRYFKPFPLVNDHPWAFRASSAGLCFFQKEPALFLRWKANVYSRQETLTVSDLDMFALDFASANDVPEESFRGCYLQGKTTDRILGDLTEGFALRVRSTPSYFVDGVLVSWFTDSLMEEFLRRTYLGGKGLPLPTPTATAAKKKP